MTPDELKKVTELRATELFHDLEAPYLHKLASIATETTFSTGKIIYRPGEVGQAIYLVLAGEVTIEMEVAGHGMVTVFTVGPGHLFGWSSIFPPRRKKASARVLEPTRAIVINASQLLDLFRSDHGFEKAITGLIAEIVADRMQATRLELAKLVALYQEEV
jgi:CRP-like cAMP-binding protein